MNHITDSVRWLRENIVPILGTCAVAAFWLIAGLVLLYGWSR